MIRSKIDQILEWMLCAILSLMVVDVVWQVLSRHVFANPSTFTDELASFLLIWLGILGGAYVYSRGEHLAIGYFAERFSEPTQRRIKIAVELVVLLFSFSTMFVGGVWLVYTRFLLNVKSAALGVGWGYVYMVLPLSGLLISYFAMDNLLKIRKKI